VRKFELFKGRAVIHEYLTIDDGAYPPLHAQMVPGHGFANQS